MQLSLAFVVVLAGLGIVVMIIIAPPPVNYSYYAGLMLIFIFGYSFIRARFVWATVSGWFIVFCYEIGAVIVSDTPLPILLNNNFFFRYRFKRVNVRVTSDIRNTIIFIFNFFICYNKNNHNPLHHK